MRKPSEEEEDEFDKLVREQKEEALKNAGIQNDEDLAAKVAELAQDLEQQHERNYSDIDLIYEKNAKKRAAAVVEETKKVTTDDNLITDDQMDSLFNSLMEEEE